MCAAEAPLHPPGFPGKNKADLPDIYEDPLRRDLPLNKIHQPRTRQRKNLCFLFVALHQHMKLFFMNCHRGCHHKDFGMFHAKCRRFQCRFNPDNRNIRIHSSAVSGQQVVQYCLNRMMLMEIISNAGIGIR